MYILIKGDLLSVMGSYAKTGSSWEKVGLSTKHFRQFNTENGLFTIIKVSSESKASALINNVNCESLGSIEEANAKIDDLFVPTYDISNESLMGLSLKDKVEKSKVKLDDMDATWDKNKEGKYLYDNGVSGIEKSKAPKHFV